MDLCCIVFDILLHICLENSEVFTPPSVYHCIAGASLLEFRDVVRYEKIRAVI